MPKSFFILILVVLGSFAVEAQNFNRPVPGDYYGYEFEDFGELPGLVISNGLFMLNQPTQPYFSSLIDDQGYVAWYTDSDDLVNDLRFWPDHGVFTFYIPRGQGQIDFYRMDQSFNVIDSIGAVGDVSPDGHEFLLSENGNRLILTQYDTVMDLSAFVINGAPGGVSIAVRSNGIQEFDEAGNLVFNWQSIDHIHPEEFIQGYNYNPNDFDYAHANSISEDLDGNLLISFRHLDAVYKIHRTTGEVIWSLGGASSDFNIASGSDPFSGQHTARRSWNGDLALFDNGNQNPVQQTRVVKYDLDTVNWVATETFSYDGDQFIYAPGTGSYQHTEEDLMCIGWGRARVPEPSVSILDGQGELQKRITYQDFVMSYRSWAGYLPFQLPRPEISCESGPQGMQLVAPDGFSNYMWSTGETTQSIAVADTGTYMVWIEHGIGRIGSLPFYVDDVSDPCGIISIREIENDGNIPVGQVDLLGRNIRTQINDRTDLVKPGSNSSVVIRP